MNRDAESSAIKLAAKLQDGAMPFDVLREAMRWAYADAARIFKAAYDNADGTYGQTADLLLIANAIKERAK